MTRYLISFNDGDMTFPDEDFPAVKEAVGLVRKEGKEKGIWLFAGGLWSQTPITVNEDGTTKNESLQPNTPHIGGFTIIDVPTKEEAFEWALKIAIACRCAQEVKEIMDDPNN